MYEVFKNVILSKEYELERMLKNIETVWAKQRFTDAELEELTELAKLNADPTRSYVSMQDQIKELKKEVDELKKEAGTEEQPIEEYPAFAKPEDDDHAYRAGSKITYNGKRYVCIAPADKIVAWSPDTTPEYWEEVVEEAIIEE